MGPQLPDRWLGVAANQINVMAYHIHNQNGKVISQYSVQKGTELEIQTQEYYQIFDEFENAVRIKLEEDCTYEGAIPNPED